MTAAELLLLMATMQCHTMSIDIPERRETVVQTVCVKVTPLKEQVEPAPKSVFKKKTKCKKRWYWRHHRKYWKCVR